MGVLVDHDFSVGAVDTALDSYSEDGIGWTQLTQTGAQGLEVVGASDHVTGTSFEASDEATYTVNVTPSAADVDIETNFTQNTVGNSGAQAHLLARVVDGANFYGLETRRHGANPDHTIYKRVANAEFELGTADVYGSDATRTFDIKFELRGTALTCFIDSVEQIAVVDESFAAAGKAGIGMGDILRTGGDIVSNLLFNSFKLTEFPAGGGPNNGPGGLMLGDLGF